MKITQIMYTNEAAGLSCRGEERFLPYGEALCLAGRASTDSPAVEKDAG
jgi:hypothetical protein